MAYLLRSGDAASGEYVALASAISIASGDNFEIEINIKANSADRIRLFGRIANFEDRAYVDSGLNPVVTFSGTTGTVTFTTTSVDPLAENVYRFVRTSGTLELFVNGVSCGTNSFGEDLQVDVLLTQGSASQSRCGTDLKYASFTVNGTLTHYYDPDLSGGTGLVLTDSTGGNNGTLTGYAGDESQWILYSAGDTTAPTFTSAPAVTATTTSGHTIDATLDEAGTLYGVRLADGATAPTSAQVKAGQDSTGSAAPEAKSAAATNSASLTFSTGSASTAYDYYIVAEDDEATPNLQASPTLVNATTSATAVPGISALTVQKDGAAVQASDWAINITLVSGGTEVYSGSTIASDASGVISAINTTGGSVGDSVRVEGYSAANNYGFVFTQNLENNA